MYSLIGHNDTVTSLQLSPDAQTLLSNSHDSTVRTWDIRPFAATDRHVRTYDGAPTTMEKNLFRASWSSNGQKIAAGSGDRSVVVWDTKTGKMLSKLPGHKGAVNDACFHPGDEPIRKLTRLSLVCFNFHASWGDELSFHEFVCTSRAHSLELLLRRGDSATPYVSPIECEHADWPMCNSCFRILRQDAVTWGTEQMKAGGIQQAMESPEAFGVPEKSKKGRDQAAIYHVQFQI